MSPPLTDQERIAFLAGWNARETGSGSVKGGRDSALGMYERGFDFGDADTGEALSRPPVYQRQAAPPEHSDGGEG